MTEDMERQAFRGYVSCGGKFDVRRRNGSGVGNASGHLAPVKASKITTIVGGIKKPNHFRPGMVALREIRKYQNSADCLARSPEDDMSVFYRIKQP
jgi:hypothetical protein